MKKISLEQLLRESGEEAYPEQYRHIRRQIETGELIPVKKSPLNGKKPALHLSYWLAEEEPDYGEETEELMFRMSPAIRTDYYLKHPKVYREEAVWVRMLNRYFLEQAERKGGGFGGAVSVSLNERSFQIWGREKFLQREQGRKILAHCGVELGQLHVYGTTEPLAYYSRVRSVPQTVLILENKDTFYSMRRCLMGSQPLRSASGKNRTDSALRTICGEPVGTLIYGAGKGIIAAFSDLELSGEPYMTAPENTVLYFGDLDYEGIGIYEHFAAVYGAQYDIAVFKNAYVQMLAKAKCIGIDCLPRTKEGQNRKLDHVFFSQFSQAQQDNIKEILECGRYIPQEILNIEDMQSTDVQYKE